MIHVYVLSEQSSFHSFYYSLSFELLKINTMMEFSGTFLIYAFEQGYYKIKLNLKKLNPLGELNRIGEKKQRMYKRSEINYTKINASNYSIIFTRI